MNKGIPTLNSLAFLGRTTGRFMRLALRHFSGNFAVAAAFITLSCCFTAGPAAWGKPQIGAPASALQPGKPEELKDVGVTERLGESVSIRDLRFLDESGKEVALSDYFHKGRPVL